MKYDGSWQLVGPAGFHEGDSPSICVESGTPYVLFTDTALSNKGTVMKFNGSTWEYYGNQGFTDGSCTNGSIKVSSTVPYIAFGDGINSGISVYKCE